MALDVIYRPFQDEDRDNVISVLLENYQLDYFHSICYDGDKLVRANRDHSHSLYVATLADGAFVGVTGAKFRVFFPQSYEMSLHMLGKRFQGQGLAKGLLGYCMTQSLNMPLTGVYGHCVTYHDVTQYEVAALGMVAAGVWPGRHLSNRTFLKALGRELRSPKLHSLVVAKAGSLGRPGPLHCPEAHGAFVRAVYGRLGFNLSLDNTVSKPAPALAALSQVEYWDNPQSVDLALFFSRIGPDLPGLVDAALASRRDIGWQTWSVFLNMACPYSIWAYEECRQRGFYFTGLHPLHGGREYLMLHREPPGGYIWEEMALTPDNQAITQYILARK